MSSVEKHLQSILMPFDERFDDIGGMFYIVGEMPIVDLCAVHAPEGEVSFGKRMREGKRLVDEALEDAATKSGIASSVVLDRESHALRIPAGVLISFCTYFNSCSIARWFEYTSVQSVDLELCMTGTFEVTLKGFSVDDVTDVSTYEKRDVAQGMRQEVLSTQEFGGCDKTSVRMTLPRTSSTIVGFEALATTDCILYGGGYVASVDQADLNDIDIVLATTTFKKEEFITRNVRMLEREIFSAGACDGGAPQNVHDGKVPQESRRGETSQDDGLSEHLRVFVVDNGQTLDPADIESEHVRLFPNVNAGGSGGFARGMIEALATERRPTHVLVMDDDVVLLPESIRRMYALLRLMKPQYRKRYISGAMLTLEAMNIQHEDVGYVLREGYFISKKGTRNLLDIGQFTQNEVSWPDFGNEYAAWWYCCIPMEYITEETLPLPLFVRGDDVEYSLRNDPGYITLNGICVWHVGFDRKYGAGMELYQVVRNSLILQACAGVCQDVDFFGQLKVLFMAQIDQLQYDYAELLLDALEDFLKGPSILEKPDGASVVASKAKKNEHLVPLDELGFGDLDLDEVYEQGRRGLLERMIHLVTYNGHRFFPQRFLDDSLGTSPYDWAVTQHNEMLKTRVLAVNPIDGTGIIRVRDQKRFKEVYRRRNQLVRRYAKEHLAVEKAWRDACPRFRSLAFWKGYLGI